MRSGDYWYIVSLCRSIFWADPWKFVDLLQTIFFGAVFALKISFQKCLTMKISKYRGLGTADIYSVICE